MHDNLLCDASLAAGGGRREEHGGGMRHLLDRLAAGLAELAMHPDEPPAQSARVEYLGAPRSVRIDHAEAQIEVVVEHLVRKDGVAHLCG